MFFFIYFGIDNFDLVFGFIYFGFIKLKNWLWIYEL